MSHSPPKSPRKGGLAAPSLRSNASAFDGRNLYISNLPYQVAGDYIAEVFWNGAQVEVDSVEVVKHGLPHGPTKACGLALVRVKTPADGLVALTKLDGCNVLGRPMIVRPDKFVSDNPNYKPALVPAQALQAVQAIQATKAGGATVP